MNSINPVFGLIVVGHNSQFSDTFIINQIECCANKRTRTSTYAISSM